MAPHTSATTTVLFEDNTIETKKTPRDDQRQTETTIQWVMLSIMVYHHTAALYGVYLMFTSAKFLTSLYAIFGMGLMSGMGITAGVHRLWAHRAYKAKLPLRIILMIWSTIAAQQSIFTWASDHRVHHKYPETDADPQNRNRGFFFAHIGWLFVSRHPQNAEYRKKFDYSDLENDPVVAFQYKYYNYIVFPIFLLASIVPVIWGETLFNSWFVAGSVRYVVYLNLTLILNSAVHTWGNRPYGKETTARNNLLVDLLTLGDGSHNYHHAFPWDYRNREPGTFAVATGFIDLVAKIGWAYDLKTTPREMIKARVQRTGDGTHGTWGWKHKDMSQKNMDTTVIFNQKNY